MPRTVTQIKFTLDSDVVSAFKERCRKSGVSMASQVAGYMGGSGPHEATVSGIATRPQRKQAVAGIIRLLTEIMGKEEAYRDGIPAQFEQRYETADQSAAMLSEAIDRLLDAY